MGRLKGSKNRAKSKQSKVVLDLEVVNATEKNLFSNPQMDRMNYLPMWYNINPVPEQIILPWERHLQITVARKLFYEMPILGAAILNKAHVTVGTAWQPQFAGVIRNDADQQWAEAAISWLKHDYYPNVNWMGQNYTFQDTLALTSKDLDVDGGSLMVFRNTKSGLPRVQLIPVDRIGSGENKDVMEGGKYDGYKVYDGVIFNSDNMPIALNILGLEKEDDQQISLFNCQYSFEAEWDGAVHGMPRISHALTHFMDIKDIVKLLKTTIKNLAAKCIIHKNGKGTMPKGKTGAFAIQRPKPSQQIQVNSEAQNKIFYESILQGGTEYISSLDGSDISAFQFDRPSPDTQAFLYQLTAESIASVGWFVELVTPQKLNGTPARVIQDQARKIIAWRQRILERRAKAMVQYGLACAMKLGLIPMTDNKTWMRWTFSKPAVLTVDSGYDSAAAQQSYLLGLSTKQELCAQKGMDWKEMDNQIDLETDALFARAKKLADKYGVSEAEAREQLSKKEIDVLAPQIAKPESQTPVDNGPDDNDSTEDDGDEEEPTDKE